MADGPEFTCGHCGTDVPAHCYIAPARVARYHDLWQYAA
jgi:hypothetical protein